MIQQLTYLYILKVALEFVTLMLAIAFIMTLVLVVCIVIIIYLLILLNCCCCRLGHYTPRNVDAAVELRQLSTDKYSPLSCEPLPIRLNDVIATNVVEASEQGKNL